VVHAAIGAFPATPLLAIHRAKITVLVGPFVPDADLVVLQIGDVGVTGEEPQQFVDDRAQMQLLGGDQREAVVEVEAHLPAEHRARAGADAVVLDRAMFENVAQQVKIDLHASLPSASTKNGSGCSNGARRDSHSSTRPTITSGSDCSWPMVTQPKAR